MDLPSIFTIDPNDLYDLIMAQIEPDLVMENVVRLDDMYKEESENERVIRMKRYKRAMDQYKIEKELYFERAQNEVNQLFKVRRVEAEQESRRDEEEILNNLESMFT